MFALVIGIPEAVVKVATNLAPELYVPASRL